jgi:hypothetical protein
MCPLKDFNSVGDVSILGYPMALQKEIDMMQVEAPWSTTVRRFFSPSYTLGSENQSDGRDYE